MAAIIGPSSCTVGQSPDAGNDAQADVSQPAGQIAPPSGLNIAIVGEGVVQPTVLGSLIRLEAIPSDGWTFESWSGDLESGQNPVTILPRPSTSLSAHFVELARDPDPSQGQPLPPPDDDADRVTDAEDSCPGTVTNPSVDANGCSDNQRDDDGDGVLNGIDICPATTSGLVVDGVGCAANQRDGDGDGIADAQDMCANTAADQATDANGCSAQQRDGDADGVTDDLDLCPSTLAQSTVNNEGCAAGELDSDGDGVFDDADQCVDTVPNTPIDSVGCALPPSVCGNLIVEYDETCDPPCNACDASCQFVQSARQSSWSPLFDASSMGFLSGVWGSDPNNVFVVGGNEVQAEIYRFDGSEWTAMDVPSVPLLIWVFGFGPDDVYAVGLSGTALHFDGATWTELTTGVSVDLWGVWGNASDDVWFVGGSAFAGSPVILHYDGTTFAAADLPPNDRGAHALFKVWGIGSKVFAVGQAGLIVEYADGAWSEVDGGGDENLFSLWGTSEDNIVAVGGNITGQIAHYDGTTWSTIAPVGVDALNAVYMTQADEAIIGGVNGYAATYDPATGEVIAETTGTGETIHAIWSDCQNRYYAVGGLFNFPFYGAALVRTTEE